MAFIVKSGILSNSWETGYGDNNDSALLGDDSPFIVLTSALSDSSNVSAVPWNVIFQRTFSTPGVI